MRFLLQNIGVIESADIKVEGLTVIAGLNNVGKSYIGKTIFAAVKAAEIGTAHSTEMTQIVGEFIQRNKDVFFEFKKQVQEEFDIKFQMDSNGRIYWLGFPDVYTLKKDIEKMDFIPDKQKTVLDLERLEKALDKQILDNFNNYIKNVFKNEYNNKYKIDSQADITCFNFEEKEELRISSVNNVCFYAKKYKWLEFHDATLIESPIVLELAAFLRDNLAFGEKQRDYMPYHFFDLIKKIILNRYAPDNNEVWTKKINEIIGGDIAFNKTTDNFTYTDVEGKQFDISNVASGIKSFALLQLLLKGEHSKETLLIIDEPEVHLHLEWQMRYAKLLVELAKEGFPILLTSHSPYFIEALKVYSDNAKIADKTHFYLGEMKENGAVFTEVSQNLDAIFEKFSAPMIKLSAEH